MTALVKGRYQSGQSWPDSFVPLDRLVEDGFPSAEANARGQFRFLNHQRVLGEPPDWSQTTASRLWRFHLHYFDWAWSFVRHPDREWARSCFYRLWSDWDERTTLGRDAWTPYVASVRAWNLCGIYEDLIHGEESAPRFLERLAIHRTLLRVHLEYDLGGNHLIKNLKAMIGLAVFFGDDRLLQRNVRKLCRQLELQVLMDGGHYERSCFYHAKVLGDLIDVNRLLNASGQGDEPTIAETIQRMRSWLGYMLMPDGDVPLFHDGSQVGPSRVALLGVAPTSGRSTILQDSGYVVFSNDRLHLVADVGGPGPRKLPGHAHAGCLSFEMTVDGERTLVDTGTSTYEAGQRRFYERSTAAHNTVEVDGHDQSEMWAAFRVARRADPLLERVSWKDGRGELVASHKGYGRLPGRPQHRRTFQVSRNRVEVWDQIEGDGEHEVSAYLHFAPCMELRRDGPSDVTVDRIRVCFESEKPGTMILVEPGEDNSFTSEDFGKLVPSAAVVYRTRAVLPVTFKTDISVR